jgi:hypothetical protein
MMKDKLVKYGRKKSYYLTRKIAILASLVIGASIVVSVPLTLKLTAKENIQTRAEEIEEGNSSENNENSESLVEEEEELLSY